MKTEKMKKRKRDKTINFTKGILYNLKRPSKNYITYKDEKVRGLYLYITKNGVISFFVQKKVDGKRILVNIWHVSKKVMHKKSAEKLLKW